MIEVEDTVTTTLTSIQAEEYESIDQLRDLTQSVLTSLLTSRISIILSEQSMHSEVPPFNPAAEAAPLDFDGSRDRFIELNSTSQRSRSLSLRHNRSRSSANGHSKYATVKR